MKQQYQFNESLSRHLGEMFDSRRNYINFLIDNLNINYEAACRRTRGEVPFTLMEAAIIAEKLQISLDSLTKNSLKKSARFDMEVIPNDNVTDYMAYYDVVFIEPYEKFATVAEVGNVLSTKAVHGDLPPIFLFPYRNLTRFNIFQWVYQLYPDSIKDGFAGVRLKDDIIERQDHIYEIMTGSKHHTTAIYGRNIISSFVVRINYFKDLGMISPDDLIHIKKELLAAVGNLEEITLNGGYPRGNPVATYLADIDFGANYIYIETKNSEMTIIDLYNMHTMRSYDEFVIKMHKKWVESLKKYSTLLNEAGDVVRSRFFRQQRAYIEENL